MKSTLNTDAIHAADGTGAVEFPDGIIADGGIVDAPYIDFNMSAVSSSKSGRMRWNSTDRCLEFDSFVDGTTVTNQIGQEVWIRVRNNTNDILPDGSPVYITGAAGNRPTVALAKSDSASTCLKYIGLTTEAIDRNEDGFVTIVGSVRHINTNSFNVGDILYISDETAGALTTVAPTAPTSIVITVGIVTVKSGTGEIVVMRLNAVDIAAAIAKLG